MLTRAIIRNFQAHAKIDLRFDRITTIVGRTDAGKSSVLRAIRLACLNTPTGKAYIKHGTDEARVKLFFGKEVLERRRGKANLYVVGAKRYPALGAGKVPPDVTAITNVRPINFQRQLDAAFWFSLTPGQVSKELNAVVNLDEIDRVLAKAKQTVGKAKAECGVARTRLKAARAEKAEWAWAPEFLVEFEALDTLQKRHARICDRIALIRDLVEKCHLARRGQKNAKETILAGRAALLAGESSRQAVEARESLEKVIRELKVARKASRQTIPSITDLVVILQDGRKAVEARQELEALLDKLKEAKAELKEKTREHSVAQEEWSKVPKCPKCNRPFSPSRSPTSI